MGYETDDVFWLEALDEVTNERLINITPEIREMAVDPVTLDRIRERTREKLNIPPEAVRRVRRTRPRFGSWAAGAAAVIAVVSVALSVPSPVSAALQRVLQFVPGFGTVQQTDVTEKIYVLPTPVTMTVGDTTITVKGVMVSGGNTVVELQESKPYAWHVNVPCEFISSDGTRHTMTQYDAAGDGRVWTVTYGFQGNITHVSSCQLVVHTQPQFVFPLHLEVAKSGKDLSAIGPTVTKQGVTIAAVPRMIGKQENVTVVSQYGGPGSVISYGLEPEDDHGPTAALTDKTGKKVPFTTPSGSSPPHSELSWNPILHGTYTLTIPEITIQQSVNEQVELPVPSKGSESIGKTVDWNGFPVTFTSVERLPDHQVRVHVDLHPNQAAARALESFTLDATKNIRGFGGTSDPQSGAMDSLEFDWPMDSNDVTLHVNSIQFVIRGPWKIPLPVPHTKTNTTNPSNP